MGRPSEQQRGSGSSSWMAQKFDLCKKKARTPGERPGGESRGIFHFKQGGRAGPLCFFLSMYSPRAHPGPPSPMDSEILIKPLSLWPEYSTGGLWILLKTGGWDAPIYAPQNTVLRAMHPGCTPIILVFLSSVLPDFATWKNPGTVVAPGFCRNINAWRTGARGGRP